MQITIKHKNFDIDQYSHELEYTLKRDSLPAESKLIKLRAMLLRAYEAGVADEKAKHDYYQDFNEQ